MKQLIILITLLSINLSAGYEKGREVFDNKCGKCHTGYVDVDTLKTNFFEKENNLLNLKAPTVNMLEYAIMRSPKKIGDPKDPEMRQIEIEEFLKEVIRNPKIENTICDPMIVKNFKAKEANTPAITDEEAIELSYFFMEYKDNREKKSPQKEKVTTKDLDEAKILKLAKDENKLILIEISSKSCYFCKKMEKEVLSLEDVKRAIDKNYIFTEVFIEESKIPFQLKKHYKELTPTFFVLSQSGEFLSSYPGAWEKEDFLNNLKENIK